MSDVVSKKVVSLSAVRKANAKRVRNKISHDISNGVRIDTWTNHRMIVKARFGLFEKRLSLTKDEINAAFLKAVNKNGKKI